MKTQKKKFVKKKFMMCYRYLSTIPLCYISSLYLHRAAGFKVVGDEDEKTDYVNDSGLRSSSGEGTAKKGLIIAAAGGKEGYQEIIVGN